MVPTNSTNKLNLDVLNQVATSDKPLKYKLNHDILDFLSNFNIKSGKFEISKVLLYELYSKWSKDPKDKQAFNKYLTIRQERK